MSGAKGVEDLVTAGELEHTPALEPAARVLPPKRSLLRRWLAQDSPYIAMLMLALIGVFLHLEPGYWAILTPIFGIICIIAGWSQFATGQGRLQLAVAQILSWCALILTIYILNFDVVRGVLDNGATSLAMLTLLALGTFMAGLQARVWRICAVGAILLAVVPTLGWLSESALVVAVAIIAIVVVGFVTWWFNQRRQTAVIKQPG